MTPEEFSTILERITQQQQTEDDLEKLRSLRLQGDLVQWVSQDGNVNVDVGQITGGEVHIGDRIYQGADAEAIRTLIREAVAGLQTPVTPPTYKRPPLIVAGLTSAGMAVGITAIRLMGLLQPLELSAYDWLFRTKPFFEKPDSRIAIVEITNDEINQFGSSEISDRTLNQILEELVKAKPFRIGVDIFRDEVQADPAQPDTAEQDYQNLIAFLENNAIVVACQVDSVSVPGTTVPSDNLQLSFSNIVVDQQGDSGIVRRQLLRMPEDPNANCQTSHSLGYKLALDYLENQGMTEDRTEATNYIQLGETVLEPVWSNTGGYRGVDEGGYQVLINYRRTPFQVFSATEILDGVDAAEQKKLKDRVVLVGYNETGAVAPLDLFDTPLGMSPGVELHAHTTSHILSVAIDDEYAHPLIKTWIEPEEIVWIALWCGVGGIMAWVARSKGLLVVMILGGGAVLIAIAWSAFAFGGWWLPLVPSVLGLGLTSVGAVVVTHHRVLQKR